MFDMEIWVLIVAVAGFIVTTAVSLVSLCWWMVKEMRKRDSALRSEMKDGFEKAENSRKEGFEKLLRTVRRSGPR